MKKISILTILGLILGVIGGLFIPKIMINLEFIGTIYINLLKFLILPIIFTSIMVTIYKSKKGNSGLIIKSVLIFIIMFVVSFLLTSLIVWIINPAENFVFEEIKWNQTVASLKPQDIIVNLFPTSVVSMIQNNSIFTCIMLAFVCGIAASKVDKGNKVMDMVEGLKNIFFKIFEYVMYLTPLATFILIGNVVAKYNTDILGIGIKYIGVAYLASLIVLFVVMILPVWIVAKVNPITYIKKAAKVWLMTITTCSSAATLSTTLKTCIDDFGIPSKITNIVVPLGTTINMAGGAVSFALLGLFCSSLYGVEITITTYIIMVISATVINMAAPGIPSGGIAIGATYLSMLGIPLSFIGFYSAIYKLLDMAYTTLNVTGDISTDILINTLQSKKKAIKS